MKTICLYFVMLFTSVFSISTSLSAKISFTIDKTFTKDTIIEIPQNLPDIFGIKIYGNVNLPTDTSLVRILFVKDVTYIN